MADERTAATADHELDSPPWRRFESTLMATSRDIRRAYDHRLGELRLNLSEACLLSYVDEHGPITQSQVAARVGMGRAAAGLIIDALAERQLLTRSPDSNDRRVWLVSTTGPGRILSADVAEADARIRVELRRGMNRAERQQLAGTLVKLRANLAAMLPPAD